MVHRTTVSTFFFFNDTATTEIYTLSLHDALPISQKGKRKFLFPSQPPTAGPITNPSPNAAAGAARSEEHTSELQSQSNLVCRLLLEKKKHVAFVWVQLRIRSAFEIYSTIQLASGV